ncbi:MAG: hypothetical protein H7X93_00485, partial [Sphingomonadaceae bacterium]|nr:hypothetical protein [Sphingomonadaceae bacterium]
MTRAERLLWIACAIAGLIALVIAPLFLAIPGIHGCIPVPEHGALVSFELVRSPEAVEALFAEQCRASLMVAMRQSLWLDGLAFIPAYTAFFILLLLALRRHGAAIAWAGIAAVAAGALCDQYEGLMLHVILADFPGDPDTFARLVPAVRGKFLALAIATALAGWLLARRAGLDRALGRVAALGGIVALAFVAGDRFVGVSLLGM